MSPDGWAVLAITFAVLLANSAYLLGFFDPNPLHVRAGLTSAITHGWSGGRPTIDGSNGFTSQAIGHLAAQDLLHLRLPWWNPFEGTGMPLAGETQSAALFPPTLLTAFSNGQLFEHILLELVAGLFTYALLRRLQLVRPAAIAGAIAFALCGKFAWFADATVNPLPFLPMLLLGIERAYAAARDGRRGGWRLMAVALALSVYAGFPEVAYFDALFGVCWLGWRFAGLERARRRRYVTKLGLGAAAGVLLAAPLLVAMSTYLSHANLGIHSGSFLGSQHLRASALPQLVLPYVYGPVDGDPRVLSWFRVGGYLSTVLLLFATLGALVRGRRGLRFVLLGWVLLVVARMYAVPPLLGHVFDVLPEMSRLQFYRYATAALELPVIVLAAIGIDDVIRVPAHRRRLGWAALGAAGVVATAALGAQPTVDSLGKHSHHGTWFLVSLLWGVLIVGAVAAVTLLRGARARAIALTALVAIDALVLFVVPEFAAPRRTKLDLAPVAYLRRHLGESRFFTLDPIKPDYGSYFGLASLGIDDFPPKDYANYVHSRLDPEVAFTGFRPRDALSARSELLLHLGGYRSAGVRYVVTRAWFPLPETQDGLRLVFRSPTTWIYRVGGAAAYFGARGCRVVSAGRASAGVACPRATTLVRRETWLPGWSAEVDGRSAPIRRVDGLFQAVTVPAGQHRVTFSFTPPGMGWALIGLLGGCVLMCAPTASARWRS